jgi:predicted phage terminase large subunit-like protein
MTAYALCPACSAERGVASFVDGVCNFCYEAGRAVPKAGTNIPKTGTKPRKNARKVVAPAQPDNVPAAVLQEPYQAPQFDAAAAVASPQAELAARVLSRRHLLSFVKRFRPKYDAGWVHIDICRRLERFLKAVEDGEEPRLLLMMPPRAGKSEIGSRHFSPWVLGHHPDWEIIAASHTTSLSMSFSRYIRDLLRDPAYQAVFPAAILDPQSQSTENWNLTAGGGYLAAGVGSAITGRGAHVLILDDLVKDIEAADSQTQRDATWEWYISTAHSRLAPGGGVLGIMCMTGDTPVLMADGTQRRLDTLTTSDAVATYDGGRLKAAVVKGLKSNGRDSVLKITTSSGKIVRANQRHPFLATTLTGELKWIRARSLSTANKIVTVKDNGGSGKALPVGQTDATSKLFAGVYALVTTAKKDGRTGTGQTATPTSSDAATHASNTAMASPRPTTPPCSRGRAACAPSVENHPAQTSPSTGESISQSTTVMTRGKYGGYCATTATQESDILELSPWHSPLPGISDFTLDEIVSVEPDGVEEVFDVQIERTENFIANGIVSHNTWWSEDDWAGRIQQVMKKAGDDDEMGGEIFEIVRYPAINEIGDEYILEDDSIAEIPPGAPVPPGATMTRPKGTALHPARYTTAAMLRKKANYIAAGLKRMWDALYQQNPTPDEGIYFGKEMFRYYVHQPQTHGRFVYQAWDFAITEKSQSDWTVGTTLLQDEYDNLYVLDVLRFRSDDGNEIIETVLDYQQQWGAQLLGFEDGQIWKALTSQFKKRCEERKIYPAYELLVPLTDKMVRANPLKGRMQIGKVYFPKNASWFATQQTEMLRFPAGKHDDQVDSLSWAVRLTLTKSAPKMPEPKPLKSWKDKIKSLGKGRGGHMAA